MKKNLSAGNARWLPYLHGLYAIIDTGVVSADSLIKNASDAIKGGATLVQYRDKTDDNTVRRAQAEALLELCRSHQIPFLINDDVQLADELGVDGVHIGEQDIPLLEARRILGENKIIGVSCYDQFSKALHASQAGANYVAFGSFFPSVTKPNAVRAGIELLHRAKVHINVPIAAIGGITLENAKVLIEAGVDMLAVIENLFKAEDVYLRAQHFNKLFRNSAKRTSGNFRSE